MSYLRYNKFVNSDKKEVSSMRIIEKAANKVFRWENVDIGVREMVQLVQSELITKCTEKELRSLLKGLNKTWVLGIGYGGSIRRLSSRDNPWTLLMDYNIFTHGLQNIVFRNYADKVAYYISGDKASVKKLRRLLVAVVTKQLELPAQYEDTSEFYSSNDFSHEALHRAEEREYAASRISNQSQRNTSRKSGKYSRNSSNYAKLSISNIFIKVICIAAAAAVIFGVGSLLMKYIRMPLPFLNPTLSRSSTPAWVDTVRNGYLGEFTDMTVSDLLWCFRDFYEKETWDGGTTKEGKRIAEVRFYNPNEDDSATVQFEMLNDEVFKLSAFVDSHTEIAVSTDLLFYLNSSYYSGRIMELFDDTAAQAQLDQFMYRVSGSEVLYGASKDYTGERSALHLLFNDDQLELSAGELMEAYGLTMLSAPVTETIPMTEPEVPDYYEYFFENATADEVLNAFIMSERDAVEKYLDHNICLRGRIQSISGSQISVGGMNAVFRNVIECTAFSDLDIGMMREAKPGDIITVQCRITGMGSGGHRADIIAIQSIEPNNVQERENVAVVMKQCPIYSSPSASARTAAQLQPGAEVEVLRYEPVGTTQWVYVQSNSLGVMGWATANLLDMRNTQFYSEIQAVAQPVQPTQAAVNNSAVTGYIVNADGGLNVRQTPSATSYIVKRLYNGDRVTILEQTYSDGMDWGRTSDGWICMAYFSTSGSTSNSGASSVIVGTVNPNTDALNVRNGPGTSFDAVARIPGGGTVKIYETKNVNGTVWGRIDSGWVSMDYIVLSDDFTSYLSGNPDWIDQYCGEWWDINSKRCNMNISRIGNQLHIEVHWSSSASESTEWVFTGEPNTSDGMVHYRNGVCKEYIYENGTSREVTRYTNGSGSFELHDGFRITWNDITEGVGNRCEFSHSGY